MKRYEIYCDASMNRKRRIAGLGVVILDTVNNTITELTSSARLNKNCSFTAELFAMAFACETIINLGIEPIDVCVMCDCMSVVVKTNLIPESDGKNIYIDKAWEKICFAKSFGTEFKWVKGHSNNNYNRKADKLAGIVAKNFNKLK